MTTRVYARERRRGLGRPFVTRFRCFRDTMAGLNALTCTELSVAGRSDRCKACRKHAGPSPRADPVRDGSSSGSGGSQAFTSAEVGHARKSCKARDKIAEVVIRLNFL